MDIVNHIARSFPAGPERDMLASAVFRIRCTEHHWTLNSQEMAGR